MNDIIYGKNSVLEALIAGKREFNKILISKNIHSDAKLNKIKELAEQKGIIYQFVAKEKFAAYTEFNHQGIIAQISPIKYMDLDTFLELQHTNASIIILDGIEDSHNLGAIITINHIPIIKVNSLTNAVEKLKKSNWWIIATDASAKDNYYDINYCDMNSAIIMGAEHAGVSKSLLKASDYIVKIPMLKDFNSLNVSNALAIIIFESVRQKLTKKY